LAALLARVDGSLDSGHGVPSSAQPEQALDELLVRGCNGLVATEGALPLRRLLLQDVRAHAVAARQLAAAGQLEALLGAGVGLHLGHQVLVGSGSGSGAAATAAGCSGDSGGVASGSETAASAASFGASFAPGLVV